MTPNTVLVVGSGGREHALAFRLRSDGARVIAAPGSDGIAIDAERVAVAVDDVEGLVGLARHEGVDLVVVGPEQPLVAGLADALRAAGLATVGPSAAAARLEGSKADAKAFMERHGIATPRHRLLRAGEDVRAALRAFEVAPVVKADGLAAGKGVVVPETFEEAEAAVRDCLERGKFGAAGSTVVLEDRLRGEEASFFALTDGTRIRTFPAAQDHKRLLDGDHGPNTGGMGAYAPAPICDDALAERVVRSIVEPTLAGLREEGRPFVGVLFVGLMIDASGGPQVIEYNCRFGDPECEALLFGLDEPLAPALMGAARGELEAGRFSVRPAATVVMAAAGYPGEPRRGDPITGLDESLGDDVRVFHAGTTRAEGRWHTAGGRVLAVTGRGADLAVALVRTYEAVGRISFAGAQVRHDVGRALGRGEDGR